MGTAYRGPQFGLLPNKRISWQTLATSYGIELAFILLLVNIGLLFLLMKEKRYTGFVTITVTGMGLYHSVQFPAAQHTGAWAADMVGRARAIAASAPPFSA